MIPKVIPEHEWSLLPDLEGKTILEMGNKGNENGVYKTDYLEAGAKSYHCVDINGKDGAIAIDLRSESSADKIREATGIDSFDIITNFGMSEHIPVQRTFYKCVHNLSRVGTQIVHWTPVARKFKGHGYQGSIWHAEKSFFDALARWNGYAFEIGQSIYDKRVLNCRLVVEKKEDFVWKEEFNLLFWYNELWEKSPWGESYRRYRDKTIFEPIE